MVIWTGSGTAPPAGGAMALTELWNMPGAVASPLRRRKNEIASQISPPMTANCKSNPSMLPKPPPPTAKNKTPHQARPADDGELQKQSQHAPKAAAAVGGIGAVAEQHAGEPGADEAAHQSAHERAPLHEAAAIGPRQRPRAGRELRLRRCRRRRDAAVHRRAAVVVIGARAAAAHAR